MNVLFTPIRIGPVTLRNRIVFPPMTTGFEEQGAVSPRSLNFYTSLAAGEVGLIVLGDVSIQPDTTPVPMLYDDRFIPGLQELTTAVHAHGASISAQLFHQEYDGAQIMQLAQTRGREAAVAQLHQDRENFCNRLSREEIERIQERFVAAALRAREAGFDMLQIHGDRLLGMFASPILNRRTDSYGGSLVNRARFALEVVRKVHAAVPELPLDYKLAIIRTDPPRGRGGPTLDEARQMADWLIEAGIATFHVCQANHGALADTIPPAGAQPAGCFTDLARAIKSAVRVPVTTVGRIVAPDLAEKLISNRLADMVALGRGLLCDPDWPRKVREGRSTEIRRCIMCNQGCTDNLLKRGSIGCIQNAALGAHPRPQLTPIADPRHLVVVGGGPAGMEAARVAAQRGYRVTLLEKESGLGGQLRIAALPPCKEEIRHVAEFLIHELQRLGVTVHLRRKAGPESIVELHPDAVILATGARPLPLPASIPGHDHRNVVQAWDVLGGAVAPGPRVVVIGGGNVGLETALYLAARRHRVGLIELQDRIGADESPTLKPTLQKLLRDYEVYVLTGHQITQIDDAGVHTVGPDHAETLACDTVVAAMGIRPDRELAAALEQSGIPFCCVGDCTPGTTGRLGQAIQEAFWTALERI